MQRHIKIWFSMIAMIALALFLSEEAKAQRVAVSTNTLEWLTLSPNLSFDVAFAQHHAFSMSASASPSAWKYSDNLFVSHISISPEYKYWFRMPFYGHFMGANLLYSSYAFSLGTFDRIADVFAAGVTYGYSLILGKRWNIVPVIGLGAGVEMGDKIKVVPAITKFGINIQLMVK